VSKTVDRCIVYFLRFIIPVCLRAKYIGAQGNWRFVISFLALHLTI